MSAQKPLAIGLEVGPDGLIDLMNKNGNPGTLIASHPRNTNAMKHGVYSEHRIQPRAAQIAAELLESFEFSVVQRSRAVRHAERLGYTRYSVAEHHNLSGIASAAT